VLAGILFVLKTGIPWEDLPQEMGCGSGMTCWRRLAEWTGAGVWQRLHHVLLDELDDAGQIDWSRAVVDSSHVSNTPPERRALLRELGSMADCLAAAYQRFAQGLGRWFDENQEGIVAVLESLQLVATVQPELKRLWDTWEETEWGHVLWELDFSSALGVMLLLDHRHDETVESILEPALTDAEFLADIKVALSSAPLSTANRRQLAKGIDFIAEREYELAVPLLIIPLEGAFWRVAHDRGLVERVKERMHFTADSGSYGKAHSVEAIFEPLGIDDDFRNFLVRLVYSTSGNAFRHGTALGGWRRAGLLLVVALVGWLDLYGSTEEKSLLFETFA
jgi:transposase